jgi:hypothetical protein
VNRRFIRTLATNGGADYSFLAGTITKLQATSK